MLSLEWTWGADGGWWVGACRPDFSSSSGRKDWDLCCLVFSYWRPEGSVVACCAVAGGNADAVGMR